MPDLNQTDIAEKVYDVLCDLVDASNMGLNLEYEYLPTNGKAFPALSMQTLAGSPIVKEYQDGTYVANYRAMLVLRQSAKDTRERLDAVRILRELADSFVSEPLDFGEGYSIWKRERENLPSRISADEAYVDCQVTVSIQYKSHRR